MHKYFILFSVLLILSFTSCNNESSSKNEPGDTAAKENKQQISNDTAQLPAPYATKSSTKFSKVIGWSGGSMPMAPEGFVVSKFADSLDNPRWIYVAQNGDIFVSEANTELKGVKKILADVSGRSKSQNFSKGANHVLLFRDKNKDGVPESRSVFLDELKQPLGMLAIGNKFYVANTDALVEFPYNESAGTITGQGKKIVELPAGGYNNHWTRNIITNAAKNKIYISVGSGSNVAEHGLENEIRRAGILEVNLDGTGEKIYASGLRNPVGMAWAPGTQTLWTAVNERDELGDELVPDYITSVKEGGFYGWPFSYFGQHLDPRLKDKQNPELVQKAIVPDMAVGAHTASLGLAFYDKNVFPAKYHNGAFVGQHGSWNRATLAGYKVVFIPFKEGRPAGKMEDFLTGFVADADRGEVYGRPVGVAVLADGSLLVADDAGDCIWRVSYKK
jgi:glucose/arabinose dehydrogenase